MQRFAAEQLYFENGCAPIFDVKVILDFFEKYVLKK